jgi:cell division protein FtsZ
VKTVMANRGRAVMGMGIAKGPGRAIEAAHKAISSPLIEDGSIKGARAVLVNITGGNDMGINEIDEVMGIIKAEVDPDANIIFGTVDNAEMAEDLKVTVIATGFDEEGVRRLAKHPANLKELMQKEQRTVVDRPNVFKRGREASASATGDLFGSKANLDLPAYLRRAAD